MAQAHQAQQQAQYTTPQVPPGMGLDAEQVRRAMGQMPHTMLLMHDDQRMFMPMPYMTPYGYPYDEVGPLCCES